LKPKRNDDVVVAIGQDGLVPNIAKYLEAHRFSWGRRATIQTAQTPLRLAADERDLVIRNDAAWLAATLSRIASI
jgi:hypothetical protein